MTTLTICSNCGGFVPSRLGRCPHCNARAAMADSGLASVARTCLKVATGGAVAMTLMACYGGPPHAYGPQPLPPDPCQGAAEATDPSCAPSQSSPPGAAAEPAYAEPPPAAVMAR